MVGGVVVCPVARPRLRGFRPHRGATHPGFPELGPDTRSGGPDDGSGWSTGSDSLSWCLLQRVPRNSRPVFRTALDLGRYEPLAEAVAPVDARVHQRLLRFDELTGRAARLAAGPGTGAASGSPP